MIDTTYLLPVNETIRTSWEKVKGSKGSFWGALVLVFVIMFGLGFTDGILSALAKKIEPVFGIFVQIFGFLLNIGVLYIGIRRAQDLPISYSFVFHAFKGWLPLKIIGLYLLQVLILMLAMIIILAGVAVYSFHPAASTLILSISLCFIGAVITIFLAIRMMLSMAFVLDKETHPWEAIKLSFRATKSNFWRLIAIFLLQSLIIIISAIPLGIGLIWTLPFSFINYGVVYKNLSSHNF